LVFIYHLFFCFYLCLDSPYPRYSRLSFAFNLLFFVFCFSLVSLRVLRGESSFLMKKLLPFLGLFLILSLFVSCEPGRSTVTLALLGDVMLGRRVTPTPASLAFLAPELQAADLSLAALESPLANYPPATAANSGYNLCAMAPVAKVLPAWGLDLLSIANNHRFDCGPEGQPETASILSNLGLTPVGPGPEPVYREINGLKLAFFSFDDILTPLDGAAVAQAIRSALADGRLVVLSVHWGLEYQAGPSDRQEALAQQFAEAGASLIIGTHPHVLQPAAWISPERRPEQSDGRSRRTLVLYSLGNALFDQPGLPDTRQSALLLVTLDPHGVRSAVAVPFEIDVPHSLIFQPDAQTAKLILGRLALSSATR
jgi:poly-gamma-glutamate synthesis protein (capsule biosynthesis protein)